MEMVEAEEDVKARLDAKGHRDPDVKDESVDTSVSFPFLSSSGHFLGNPEKVEDVEPEHQKCVRAGGWLWPWGISSCSF